MKVETYLYRKEIGKRIKEVRTERGETQEVFSENVGIAKQTLVNLEYGSGSLKLEYLYQIANYCNCDIGFLLGEYEERTYKAKYVCDMTGLNEEAANFLISINNDKIMADSFLNNPRFKNDEYFKLIKRNSELFLKVLNSLLKRKPPVLQLFELLSFNDQRKEIEGSSWFNSLQDYSGYSVEEVINILKDEGLSNEEIEKIELITRNYFGIIYGLDEEQNYLKYQAYKEFIKYLDELII